MNSTRAADTSTHAVSPLFIRPPHVADLPAGRSAASGLRSGSRQGAQLCTAEGGGRNLSRAGARIRSQPTREPGAHRAERVGWKPPTVEPDPGNAGAGRSQRMELGRLHVIVDVAPQSDQDGVTDLVRSVLRGGAPVVQLRAKGITDSDL